MNIVRSSVELVVDAACIVGEGPLWDASSGCLIWVDIVGRLIHWYRPADSAHWTIGTPSDVGAVACRGGGGLVLALDDGFWLLDPGADGPRMFASVEADDPTTRMNDGKCDRAGRFWAGTMQRDARTGGGTVYRLDGSGHVETMITGVTISNGLAWSPDDEVLYYIDSPKQGVDTFAFDAVTGTIAARRRAFDIPPSAGLPDGMTIDAEGCLWVALWGGAAVHRYTPDGELRQIVEVPVAQVTSCAFGGPDLTDLYITTASHGLDDPARRAQPQAGGLYRCRPGTRGTSASTFAG